jgi:acetyl esterase/lipase
MAVFAASGNCRGPHCRRRRQCWRRSYGRIDRSIKSGWRRITDVRVAGIAVGRFDYVRFDDHDKDAVDPLIHKAYLEELAGAYVPAGTDRMDPTVSPLFGDLRGFPPTLIQVGSAETLLADATRFAAAAGTADVSVRLEIWRHMIHAWHLWNAHLEAGRRALRSAGEFIRAYV